MELGTSAFNHNVSFVALNCQLESILQEIKLDVLLQEIKQKNINIIRKCFLLFKTIMLSYVFRFVL